MCGTITHIRLVAAAEAFVNWKQFANSWQLAVANLSHLQACVLYLRIGSFLLVLGTLQFAVFLFNGHDIIILKKLFKCIYETIKMNTVHS